jgi:serine/threonine-protein kinase
LTRNGLVKVLDFGIARARETIASVGGTGTGTTLGTPGFMAPEQAMGKTREIDGRTDVWAAGATFLSLVSGQHVHLGESAQELVIKAATQPARSLSTVAPHVSPALAAIIDRALAFRREERWETAGAMRDALVRGRGVGGATPEAVVASLMPGGSRPAPMIAPSLPTGKPTPLAAFESPSPGREGPVGARTTSSAISSDPERTSPPRSRRWVVWTAAGTALGIAAGTYVVRDTLHSTGPEPAVVRSAGIGVSETASAAVSVASADVVPDAQVPVVPAVKVAVTPLPAAKVKAPLPPPASTNEALKPVSKTQKDQAKPASPDCVLNYTLDAEGRKHFKPECFLKN